MRRVVITGIGIVSCIGNNKDEVAKSLKNGISGITKDEKWPSSVFVVKYQVGQHS